MSKVICGRVLPKAENASSKREEKEETAGNSPLLVKLSVSCYQVYDPNIFVLLYKLFANITDKDEISKIRRAAISDARIETGANGKGTRISISDGEWEAIQAGAISDTTLKEILRYADPDVIRERATPRTRTEVSDARANRIRAMANSGHTNAEIADALNLSPSAVSRILNE